MPLLYKIFSCVSYYVSVRHDGCGYIFQFVLRYISRTASIRFKITTHSPLLVEGISNSQVLAWRR